MTALALALAAMVPATRIPATAQAAGDPALMVVYGALSPSREGDVDLREQVFFSVPATTRDRLYLRVYDPEVSGANDFILGGSGNSSTVFRVFGGDGAFSLADRPAPVRDGARVPSRPDATPVSGPGELIAEKSWGNARATDRRWANLAAVRASQGEVIGDRAFFRLDVQGAGGDDGNGFSLAVSLGRDRNRAPAGLRMFSFRPTVRWMRGTPATRVRFTGTGEGDLIVQSFDAANGSITVTTDFEDIPVRVSGQNFWTSDAVRTADTDLAISLQGGFETPNDVTLAVFDATGNPLPLTMPPVQAPEPARPTAGGTGNPLADCRSVAFDASDSGGRTPLKFRWSFGDGSDAADPVVAHRYSSPGRYTARLEVVEAGRGPGRGAAVDLPVHVRNAPVAVPGADIVVAPGQQVEFDGSASIPSDSPITRYRWNFGDGTGAAGARAAKSFASPGLYRAVLRVEDDSRHPCNFGVDTRRVIVNSPPVAEAGSDQSAVVGRPVIFDAGASYDIDGVLRGHVWNMGDGTIVEGARVRHAYDNPGQYRVTLTVTDDSGVANNVSVDSMQVDVNAPPVPRIALPSRPMSVSEVADLDATASSDEDGAILSYIWDFGDGASGEGETAEYAWARAGTFTVTLTVIDDSGTASATQSTREQIVIDAAPVADAGPDQYVTASEVSFDGGGSTDSDGRVTSYVWDFGDGGTATGRRVSHAYLRPGVYEVALVVRDDSTAPLNVHRDTMTVTVNAAPIADAGPAQLVAPGEEFVVSARASVDPDGRIADYLWTFPDGTTARGVRAAHAFTEPGLYRIGLTVFDDFTGGAATNDAEVFVTVNAPPVAKAGPDRLTAPGQNIVFDGGQSFDPDGALTGYHWEFDDLAGPQDGVTVERAFLTPGIRSAQLIVTDDSGVGNATSADDVTIRVNHGPVADAGAAIDTDRLIVDFDGSASSDADGDALIYTWDFGDGSPPVQGRQVRHVYPRSGVYPVTLRVDDGTGLPNAVSVDSTVAKINTRPVADAGGNRAVCSGEPILFDASDSTDPDGGLLRYSWDFGDGTGSDLINPTKTYERPGIYPVTLRIANETGTAHGTDVDRIAALVREGPIADAGPDMSVCTNQSVRFDGSGSTDADGAVNAFSWTFGDGGIGSGAAPTYVYDKPGLYTVTLTIAGEALGDCSPLDVDTAQISVAAAPEQKISGFDRAAAGQPATFRAELDKLGGARVVGHRWTFSDGAAATGASATHTFDAPGEYLITLVTELAGGSTGCATVETVRNVIVNAAPEPAFTGPDRVAAGQFVIFDASASVDLDGAITGFAWDFGDGTTASGVRAAHTFPEPGTYGVRLEVTDDAGVANSTVAARKTLLVSPAPRAALRAPPPMCPGEDTKWAVDSNAATQVTWTFGNGVVRSGPEVGHVFDRAGLFPVVVSMDDGSGLANARQSKEVYARINARPTAMAGPDRVICPGDEVTFDGGLSGDLDGPIVEWVWRFSDGITLNGERVARTFDEAADLRAVLTVRDASGSACATGTDSARVLVNATPVVDAGPDLTTPVGAAHDLVDFDASGASDADGQGLRVSWDFGDGSEISGARVRHRFTAPGVYTVRVRAEDTTGLACGVGIDTATVTAVARQ